MTILLRIEQIGSHAHVDVFIGPDRDHVALCGALVMDPEEAEAFRATLLCGLDATRLVNLIVKEG